MKDEALEADLFEQSEADLFEQTEEYIYIYRLLGWTCPLIKQSTFECVFPCVFLYGVYKKQFGNPGLNALQSLQELSVQTTIPNK